MSESTFLFDDREGRMLKVIGYKVEVKNVSEKRITRRKKDAKELKEQGYIVEDDYPNGVYFALKNGTEKHKKHELEACRFLAKCGISSTLDEEGNITVRLDGVKRILASLDGTIEGYTQEIKGMSGKITADKIEDVISHSYKVTKGISSKAVEGHPATKQATIAVGVVLKGNKCNRGVVANGIMKYRFKRLSGKITAKPKFYLHIDENTGDVYAYKL